MELRRLENLGGIVARAAAGTFLLVLRTILEYWVLFPRLGNWCVGALDGNTCVSFPGDAGNYKPPAVRGHDPQFEVAGTDHLLRAAKVRPPRANLPVNCAHYRITWLLCKKFLSRSITFPQTSIAQGSKLALFLPRGNWALVKGSLTLVKWRAMRL